MKKKLLLVLMLIAAVVVMPRVYADDEIEIGTVTDITKEDTLKSDAEHTQKSLTTEGNVTTIRYDGATFQLLAETGSGEEPTDRPDNVAWIGIKITKPTNASTYTVKFNGEETSIKNQSISNDYEEYIGFTATDLENAAKAGTVVTKTLEVTWTNADSSKSVTQTVIVIVNPKGITLQAKDDESEEHEVWNAEKYEANIKTVKVTVKAMKDGKDAELPETAVTEYTLKEVYTLTDEQVAAIKAVLTDEDVELVGLYTDAELKTEFDATKALDADVTVYVAYKTKEKAPVEEEKAPDTVDNGVMYIALAGASLLVAGGVAVYFKRFN